MPISDVHCRNVLTGFRSGWQHLKTASAAPSTFAVNSNAEPAAQVDRFDYAADESEDDTKEATLASMSVRKPIIVKDEPSAAKVRSTKFYPN